MPRKKKNNKNKKIADRPTIRQNRNWIPLAVPAQTQYTFTEFYKEYYIQLQKALARLVRVPEDAEDLAQDALLRVLEAWERLDFSRVHSYLSVIASNIFKDYLRSKDGIFNATEKQLKNFIDDDQVVDLTEILNPEEFFLEVEFKRRMTEACEELLTPLDARILYLIYYKQLSSKEAADIVGISALALRQRQHRSQSLFRYCHEMTDFLELTQGENL